jgi:hypothetical protein
VFICQADTESCTDNLSAAQGVGYGAMGAGDCSGDEESCENGVCRVNGGTNGLSCGDDEDTLACNGGEDDSGPFHAASSSALVPYTGATLALVPSAGAKLSSSKRQMRGSSGLILPEGVSTNPQWAHDRNKAYSHRFPLGVLDVTPAAILRLKQQAKVCALCSATA